MTDTESTPQWLREIENRANAATEGPWEWSYSYQMYGRNDVRWCLVNPTVEGKTIDASLILDLDRPEWFYQPADSQPNWQFIAHARTDIPKLITAYKAVVAERDALLRALKENQDAS